MRILFIFLAVALLALLAANATGWWRYSGLFPKPSQESVQLSADRREALNRLKEERKFEPHDYPPLGYTGVATSEDGVIARAAVNDIITSILSRADGPVSAETVSGLIGRGMKRVDQLETEDRDRAAGLVLAWFQGCHGTVRIWGGIPAAEGLWRAIASGVAVAYGAAPDRPTVAPEMGEVQMVAE